MGSPEPLTEAVPQYFVLTSPPLFGTALKNRQGQSLIYASSRFVKSVPVLGLKGLIYKMAT